MDFESRLSQLYKPTDGPPPILEPTATKTYDAPIVPPQPTPTPTYVAPPPPPRWEAPPLPTVYKCPKCGAPFSSPTDLERHIIKEHPPIIIEEEVDKMDFKGITIPLDAPPREPLIVREHTGTCPRCSSILQIICTELTIPPSPERAIAPTSALCPVCGAVAYQEEGMVSRVKAILVRRPWPPEEEKPPEEVPVFPETKMIDEELDKLEQQIRQLEEAFRTAKGAELYDNVYAPIQQHATKLLAGLEKLRTFQYPRVSPERTPFWTTAQKMRLEGLISRLKKLITDCWEETKRIKPLPTSQDAKGIGELAWITQSIGEKVQQGIPDYQWPSLTPKPTVTDTVPPAWFPYIGEPEPLGEYSVTERWEAIAGEEPWGLAEAVEAPALSWAKKNWLPLTIMGALGVTALGVYYKKRKGVRR